MIKVNILPISGGKFPVQLGLLSAVIQAHTILRLKIDYNDNRGEKPDIVLSASGGNIAAYVCQASVWNKDKMFNIINNINSDGFAVGWCDPIPSIAFMISEGSAFRTGYGFEDLFKKTFTKGMLKHSKTEIWTGVWNSKEGKQRLFVFNFIIHDENNVVENFHLGTDMEPHYCDGDRKMLSNATLASAAIPFVLQPVNINNEQYGDIGMVFSSPLPLLHEHILDVAKDKILKKIYFSPVSICDLKPNDGTGIISTINKNMLVMRSVDMKNFINIISRLNGNDIMDKPEIYNNLNIIKLAELIGGLEVGGTHYAIMLFPDIPNYDAAKDVLNLDLLTVKPSDIKKVVNIIENNIGAYVWTAVKN
jgi:hypothetical protein